MRRVVGVLLIALGVFAVTLGFTLPTVVYDRLAVAPLDPDSETVAQGTNMTVLYPSLIAAGAANPIRTDATVTARRIVSGKFDAPEVKVNGDVALWRVGLVVEDERCTLINAVEQWVCVDRRTAEGQRTVRSRRSTTAPPSSRTWTSPAWQYKFPFDTERKEYMFFDVTLRKATPIQYDGTRRSTGWPRTGSSSASIRRRWNPRRAGGTARRQPPAPSPPTGCTRTRAGCGSSRSPGRSSRASEESAQWLRNPANRPGVPVLAGTLTWTPQTVQRQVDAAREAADKLVLLTRTGPIVLWIGRRR